MPACITRICAGRPSRRERPREGAAQPRRRRRQFLPEAERRVPGRQRAARRTVMEIERLDRASQSKGSVMSPTPDLDIEPGASLTMRSPPSRGVTSKALTRGAGARQLFAKRCPTRSSASTMSRPVTSPTQRPATPGVPRAHCAACWRQARHSGRQTRHRPAGRSRVSLLLVISWRSLRCRVERSQSGTLVCRASACSTPPILPFSAS